MSIQPLGHFNFINQFRLAFRPQEAKGGSAQVSSPYFNDYATGPASGDRLELRSAAAWEGLGNAVSVPASAPTGGSASEIGTEPTGGSKVPKPAVVQMPSPNFNSRNGAKIDTIVLHHTAGGGTAQDTGRFFQNPASQVSSHYIVGKDGTIVQSVQDGDRAWHAGASVFKGRSDVNDFSLGIEIVNQGDGHDPYTDAQYKALGKLVAYMMSTYGVPFDRITGHKDVAIPRGRKTDPSSNFSYDRLKAEVQKNLNGQQSAAPQPAPKPPKTEPKNGPKPAPQSADKPAPGGTYTVKSGDSLGAIAQRTLGNANRWREIYNLNRDKISNPNLIYPGQTLKLPGKAAEAPKPAPSPKEPPKGQPDPKPAPKPDPAPTPAPTPAPQPAPQVDYAAAQAQIAAMRQQLEAIQAEINGMIAQLNAQQPSA